MDKGPLLVLALAPEELPLLLLTGTGVVEGFGVVEGVGADEGTGVGLGDGEGVALGVLEDVELPPSVNIMYLPSDEVEKE